MKKVNFLKHSAAALMIVAVALAGCKDKGGDDPVKVTGVTLDRTSLALTVGKNATLTATVEPEDATDRSVNWTSSKPDVATVVNGVVIAEAAGTAVIVVTTTDGGKTAVCNVTVTTGTDNPEEPEDPTDPTVPALTTLAATNVTISSATLNGNVTVAGDPPYTERGFYLAAGYTPTETDVRILAPGTGTGTFSVTKSALGSGITCHVRAYVRSTAGITWGNEITFTTSKPGLAALTTSPATEVTVYKAVLWGNITDEGDPAYTERGFYFATGRTPTETDTRILVAGRGTGTFSNTINGLQPGTTYHVRAYARSTAGIAWGNEITFTTPEAEREPKLSSLASTNLTDMRVTLNASIGDVGNPAYTERGFCWKASTTSTTPTVIDNRTPVAGSGTGAFSKELTGLQGSKTYYVRAYAVSALGTFYSNVTSVTTHSIPDAPADLVAVAVSSSQVDLHWAAVPDAIGYKVQYRRSSGAWTQLPGESTIEGTTCHAVGLTAGTFYYFRVCAYTLNGDSSYSEEDNAITLK